MKCPADSIGPQFPFWVSSFSGDQVGCTSMKIMLNDHHIGTKCMPSTTERKLAAGKGIRLPLQCFTLNLAKATVKQGDAFNHDLWTIGCVRWKNVICKTVLDFDDKRQPSAVLASKCTSVKQFKWLYADTCRKRKKGFYLGVDADESTHTVATLQTCSGKMAVEKGKEFCEGSATRASPWKRPGSTAELKLKAEQHKQTRQTDKELRQKNALKLTKERKGKRQKWKKSQEAATKLYVQKRKSLKDDLKAGKMTKEEYTEEERNAQEERSKTIGSIRDEGKKQTEIWEKERYAKKETMRKQKAASKSQKDSRAKLKAHMQQARRQERLCARTCLQGYAPVGRRDGTACVAPVQAIARHEELPQELKDYEATYGLCATHGMNF